MLQPLGEVRMLRQGAGLLWETDTSGEAQRVKRMWCEGAAVGSEGVCPCQDILQMVALEQNWHLQTLDMELSKRGHGITPDKGNCQPLSLGEKETQHFPQFCEPV